MEMRDGALFQTAISGAPPAQTARTQRFDLVTGSGRKGQTYLYWNNDRLFQLPVSFWNDPAQWVPSPGFSEASANFDRPVLPRCLECHATFFQSAGQLPNQYNTTNFMLGVGCETCHGPSAAHVARRRGSRTGTAGTGAVNPGKLSRERQVELCAFCHAGAGQSALQPAFSYRPGEPLEKYVGGVGGQSPTLDVHGNQVGLLMASRCYKASTMTCSTCHNVHQTQRDAPSLSSKCAGCHDISTHKTMLGAGSLARGCVDCHMPVQQSASLVTYSNGKAITAAFRTHLIKVYRERAGATAPGR